MFYLYFLLHWTGSIWLKIYFHHFFYLLVLAWMLFVYEKSWYNQSHGGVVSLMFCILLVLVQLFLTNLQNIFKFYIWATKAEGSSVGKKCTSSGFNSRFKQVCHYFSRLKFKVNSRFLPTFYPEFKVFVHFSRFYKLSNITIITIFSLMTDFHKDILPRLH